MKGLNIMHMGFIVLGVVLIIIAAFELIEVRKMVHRLQTEGGPDTSSFIGYALWSAVVVAIFLVFAGIGVIALSL